MLGLQRACMCVATAKATAYILAIHFILTLARNKSKKLNLQTTTKKKYCKLIYTKNFNVMFAYMYFCKFCQRVLRGTFSSVVSANVYIFMQNTGREPKNTNRIHNSIPFTILPLAKEKKLCGYPFT